jgi:hypothetical protein
MLTTSAASCVRSALMSLWLRSGGSCTTMGVDTLREQALDFLERLFSTGPLGAVMACQAEEGIGDPTLVSASATFLATDVVEAVGRQTI